jgi:hypothetical protein
LLPPLFLTTIHPPPKPANLPDRIRHGSKFYRNCMCASMLCALLCARIEANVMLEFKQILQIPLKLRMHPCCSCTSLLCARLPAARALPHAHLLAARAPPAARSRFPTAHAHPRRTRFSLLRAPPCCACSSLVHPHIEANSTCFCTHPARNCMKPNPTMCNKTQLAHSKCWVAISPTG